MYETCISIRFEKHVFSIYFEIRTKTSVENISYKK